jgi:hypothetical protein
MIYRYASEMKNIALVADFSIASSFLVSSIVFCITYLLVKKSTVETLTEKVFKNFDEDGISSKKFWSFSGVVFLIFVVYHLTRYVRFGGIDGLFFPDMNYFALEHNNQILTGNKTPDHFLLRLFSWLSRYGAFIIVYLSIALLFESLRKEKRLKGYLHIFCISFVTLLSFTGSFLYGYRTVVVIVISSIFILGLSSLLFKNRRLTKCGYIITALFVVYSTFWLLTINSTRASFIAYQHRKIASQQTQAIPSAQLLPDGQTAQAISSVKQQTIISVITKTTENYNLTQSASNIAMISEKQYRDIVFENFEQEEQYLKTWHSYGWAASKDIAWELLYFGRHSDFLGLFYDAKICVRRLFPGNIQRQLGLDLPTIGQIIYKTRRHKGTSEAAVGVFGNGYACYGYTGAYLYCIVWAIFCGVMSKFCVTYIFTETPRYETTALGVFLLFATPIIFCGSVFFVLNRLLGFTLLFLFELIIIKLITLICNVKSKSVFNNNLNG